MPDLTPTHRTTSPARPGAECPVRTRGTARRHGERALALLAALLASGCAREQPGPLLGTTEWDQVTLVAEAAEPVRRIAVREGERVTAGQLLLELDPARADASLQRAEAEVARLEALLAEQRNGTRRETLDAARARLARAASVSEEANRERARQQDLRRRGLAAQAALDAADTAHHAAEADRRAAAATLAELLAGTRIEALEQTEATLLAAQASAVLTRIARERLAVRAPRDGVVDAIPVEVGDQPAIGAPVLTLLVGAAPHARVYVPERVRAALAPGARFRVRVDGVAEPMAASLRHVRDAPSFTPYFALHGDDASRLVYLAEIELLDAEAAALPAGLPLQAEPVAP